MSLKRLAFSLILLVVLPPTLGTAQTRIRIATYNIKFLDKDKLPDQGDRREKITAVIADLDADIIGLQEIDDRAALQEIFDASQWHLVIDDDSGDTQDLALAVRKPLEVVGLDADLDADDGDFLFPSSQNNSPFPRRRDVLKVQVRVPDENVTVTVMVHHGKSRFDGRADSEDRRVQSAQRLIQKLDQEFDGSDFILLGDFNDNPDDRSLNILESGDNNAVGGAEDDAGPFLINLTEPLCVIGHVSHGLKSNDVVFDRVNTVDPESRQRNNDLRGTDAHSGDILFDQILVPPQLLDRYVARSVAVYDGKKAVIGNDTTRASDHLPVYADFVFGESAEPEASVRIVALLPDPDGRDNGNEVVTLRNATDEDVPLVDWQLKDRAGNTYDLSSHAPIPANGQLEVLMMMFSMPLTNSGDEVHLLDAAGNERHSVSYEASQVHRGQTISFP